MQDEVSSPPAPAAFAPGDKVDRYVIESAVAHGGMGNVWLARLDRAHEFKKHVAIKTMSETLAGDDRSKSMFLDEGRILSRIAHANVAQILDLGEHRGVPYLVLEWLDGESLEKMAEVAERDGGRLPLGLVLRAVADACEGLHAAHELCDESGASLAVVHRDVSPDNIIVTRKGVTKLIDFGIAKTRLRLTADTTGCLVKGKPQFMSPEQAMGLMVDRRADVWSMGCVLFRLLGGAPPFTEPDHYREFIEGSRALPALPAHVPEEVALIVRRALARDPRRRFDTAASMHRLIESAMMAIHEQTTTADVAAHLGAKERGQRVASAESERAARRATTGPCSIVVSVRDLQPETSEGATEADADESYGNAGSPAARAVWLSGVGHIALPLVIGATVMSVIVLLVLAPPQRSSRSSPPESSPPIGVEPPPPEPIAVARVDAAPPDPATHAAVTPRSVARPRAAPSPSWAAPRRSRVVPSRPDASLHPHPASSVGLYDRLR